LTSDPSVTSERRKTSHPALHFLRDIAIIFLAALLVSFLVKTFLIRSFYIPSGSMQNTLQINDRIIVNELVPSVVPLKHGDVIVFKDPGGWLTADDAHVPEPVTPAGAVVNWLKNTVGLGGTDENDHLVKRVIGLPGDHVTCCNALGQLSVNGVPLEEPYIFVGDGDKVASEQTFDVTVPKNDVWVMGDHRNESADSRFHLDSPTKGFVPYSDVVGRAVVISWPLSRWSILSDYPAVYAGTERKSSGK